MVTLQIVPYHEVENLTSVGKIRKLLNIAKDNKIVLLQGRLEKAEETELIKATMEEIDKTFRGIELAVIDPSKQRNANSIQKFRNNFAEFILGNRQGLTIIGPANVVRKIKKDPNKIELFTRDARKKKRRR